MWRSDAQQKTGQSGCHRRMLLQRIKNRLGDVVQIVPAIAGRVRSDIDFKPGYAERSHFRLLPDLRDGTGIDFYYHPLAYPFHQIIQAHPASA